MERIHHTKYEHNRSIFDNSQILDIKCEILDIVKNAPIFLIFVVWNQLTKWIHHIEFEQIWSIFDNLELDTNFWTMSKMLRLCSYLVWWILFMSWFYKQNMSAIGAFLTMSKILDLNKNFGWKSRIWKTIFFSSIYPNASFQ